MSAGCLDEGMKDFLRDVHSASKLGHPLFALLLLLQQLPLPGHVAACAEEKIAVNGSPNTSNSFCPKTRFYTDLSTTPHNDVL